MSAQFTPRAAADPVGKTEAHAYREGWAHCLAGNDGRWGNPYPRVGKLSYAFDHGFVDCMEAEDGDTCEPGYAGYGDNPDEG